MQEKTQKKSLIKQNILQFLAYKGISPYKFYKGTGITRGILEQNNGISEENIARFLVYFPEIDANWLLTGCGGMLKKEGENDVSQSIVGSNNHNNNVQYGYCNSINRDIRAAAAACESELEKANIKIAYLEKMVADKEKIIELLSAK
jgi:hypothetical protein